MAKNDEDNKPVKNPGYFVIEKSEGPIYWNLKGAMSRRIKGVMLIFKPKAKK